MHANKSFFSEKYLLKIWGIFIKKIQSYWIKCCYFAGPWQFKKNKSVPMATSVEQILPMFLCLIIHMMMLFWKKCLMCAELFSFSSAEHFLMSYFQNLSIFWNSVFWNFSSHGNLIKNEISHAFCLQPKALSLSNICWKFEGFPSSRYKVIE